MLLENRREGERERIFAFFAKFFPPNESFQVLTSQLMTFRKRVGSWRSQLECKVMMNPGWVILTSSMLAVDERRASGTNKRKISIVIK